MDEEKLKLREKVKKTLSIVTDDFGNVDVDFLENIEYPFIMEIREEDELDQDNLKVTKIEIEDIDKLEKEFKALPLHCEVRIVGLVSTMILKCRDVE